MTLRIREVKWPGNVAEVPIDTAALEAEEENTKFVVIGGLVGAAVVFCLVLLVYTIYKHREHLKDTLTSFLNRETMLLVDGVFELVDLVGDIYSVAYMERFRTRCTALRCMKHCVCYAALHNACSFPFLQASTTGSSLDSSALYFQQLWPVQFAR